MRGRTNIWVAVALVALLALAMGLAACGGSSSSGGASSSAAAAGQPGQGRHADGHVPGRADRTLDPAIAWELTFMEHRAARPTRRSSPTPSKPGVAGTARWCPSWPPICRRSLSSDGKDLHLPPASQGAKFGASRESRGDGRGLQVQLRAHDEQSALAPPTFFYTGIAGAEEFQAGKATEISGVPARGRSVHAPRSCSRSPIRRSSFYKP